MEYSFSIVTAIIGLAIGFFIFLLNKTDFLMEYSDIFHLGWLFRIKEYKKWLLENKLIGRPNYCIFIRETYQCFFSRLIGCPICLITFMSFALYGILFIYNILSQYKNISLLYNLTDGKTVIFNYGLIFIDDFIFGIFQALLAGASGNLIYFKLVDMYNMINKSND